MTIDAINSTMMISSNVKPGIRMTRGIDETAQRTWRASSTLRRGEICGGVPTRSRHSSQIQTSNEQQPSSTNRLQTLL